MKQFLIENIMSIIATLLGGTGLAGWFFERRKRIAEANGMEAENESKEIDNGSKVVELYRSALDDLGVRYEKKFAEVVDLYERKIKVLEDEIRLHKRIISNLKKENSELRKQLKEKAA
jgi:predicted RNase H-like nuclease (RuvC/YqgF family)